ncbi:putative lipoprotein [Flavobacterium daejeonense]|nr:putative lipoprotein [Flavobacterium daejeonense]
MKKIITLFTLCLIFFSCSDNGFKNNNPYIPNYNFSTTLNLAFYQNLTYPGGTIYYSGVDVGPKGIFIINTTGTDYNAFDAACPNQSSTSCTNRLTLDTDKISLKCSCGNEKYNLYTGQSNLQYPLKQYRVEVSGDRKYITIYN